MLVFRDRIGNTVLTVPSHDDRDFLLQFELAFQYAGNATEPGECRFRFFGSLNDCLALAVVAQAVGFQNAGSPNLLQCGWDLCRVRNELVGNRRRGGRMLRSETLFG